MVVVPVNILDCFFKTRDEHLGSLSHLLRQYLVEVEHLLHADSQVEVAFPRVSLQLLSAQIIVVKVEFFVAYL